jgi:hypothetical protein
MTSFDGGWLRAEKSALVGKSTQPGGLRTRKVRPGRKFASGMATFRLFGMLGGPAELCR